MNRNFSIKTSNFALPKGSSPADTENVKLVKRIMKSATGAETVDVSFSHDGSGEPITDYYNIELAYPNFLADGKYITTANLKPDQGKVLLEVINALTGGGDAKSAVQKLMDSVSSGGGEGDSSVPDSSPDGEESGKSLDSPSSSPGGSSPLPGGNKPAPPNPKMPFAQKNSRFYRASKLERQYGMDLRDAIDLVKTIDESPNFDSFVRVASRKILDENDRPLTHREYAEFAKVAGGDRVNDPKA